MKKQNWVIIGTFLMMIFGVAILNLLTPTKEFSEKENRVLANMPQLTLSAYMSGSFAADYENFIKDQFVARDHWIGVKRIAETSIGKREIKEIYLADDDYLIEKHHGIYETEQASQNIISLTAFVENAVERYGENHVRVIVAPNAVNILQDKLPPYADTKAEHQYLQGLAKSLPAGTWLDSEAILKEHKEEYLYYKTDHHWTTLAAFYVAEGWRDSIGLPPMSVNDYEVEVASDLFKGTIEAKVGGETATDTIEIYQLKQPFSYTVTYGENGEVSDTLYHFEALETKDMYTLFFGGNYPEVRIEIDNGSDRKLLVVKDSYAHCFLPFAFSDFGEITMVDMRYYNQSLQLYMDERDFTDVLFLNNVSGFAADQSIGKLIN